MQILKIDEVYRVTFTDGSTQYVDKYSPPPDKPDPDDVPGGDDNSQVWEWAVVSVEDLNVYTSTSLQSAVAWSAVKDDVFEVKAEPVAEPINATWQWRETRDGHFIQEIDLRDGSRYLSIGLPDDGDDDFPDEPPDDDGEWFYVASSKVNTRVKPNTSGTAVVLQGGREVFATKVDPATPGYDAKWVWYQIQMTNSDTATYKGRYVAVQSADGKTVYLKIKEQPRSEPVRRRGAKRALVGTQTIPVITKDGKIDNPFMANVRPLAYGGINLKPFEHSTNHFIDFTLERLSIGKFSKIRFYAPMLGVTDEFMLDRIEATVQRLANYGLEPMITLLDCVDGGVNSPHRYTEDQAFYAGGFIKPAYFTEKQYLKRMKPFVTKLVTRLKGKVWAYGVANEPRIYGKAPTAAEQEALIIFLHDIANVIHLHDPDVLVTPGLLNIAHLHNGVGTIKQAWDDVYGSGNFDFAGVNLYEKQGQEPGALWEHEQLVRDHDLKYSREMEFPLPIFVTEYWRHNKNPHGTTAIVRKTEQWEAFGMEGAPWGAWFGPDQNMSDNENGWCQHADPQWEASLAHLADVYIPRRLKAYGLM